MIMETSHETKEYCKKKYKQVEKVSYLLVSIQRVHSNFKYNL